MGIDECKKLEKNNGNIALNTLYASPHQKKISLVYKSKCNRKRKNQVVLLMITDDEQQDNIEKWHYIALKNEIDDDGNKKPTQCLSALYRGVTSNHNGDFYCLGCLHSYRTDNALKKHKRLYGKHDYCKVNMLSKDKNTLKYNPGEKSLREPHIFYLDLESLLVKTKSSQNNPEKSYRERKAIHVASGYSLDLVTSYDQNKDKHTFYRGTDCTKKLCDDLKDHAMDIINAEKKVIISLTDYEKRVYEKQNYCHICKRKFCYDKDNKSKCKVFRKVRDHYHYNTGKFRGAAHNICNRRYNEKREIPVVLHNGSNYDYHLI